MLAFFVFHVSVYDKDLDPMITLNKRFKTPVRKIFPRFIVCRRLRTQGRCRKLLWLCWPLHLHSRHPKKTSEELASELPFSGAYGVELQRLQKFLNLWVRFLIILKLALPLPYNGIAGPSKHFWFA